MADPKKSPVGPSPALGRMLLAATPEQREEAIRIASKLLAIKAKKANAADPTAMPTTMPESTSETSFPPTGPLPSGDLDLCSAQLLNLGIDLDAKWQQNLLQESQGAAPASSDSAASPSSTAPPSGTAASSAT